MPTSTPVEITCPHCLAINRVPAARLADAPRCGRCNKLLFAGIPMALDQAAFTRVIAHTGVPVVLDCWAPWCAPCRQFAPVFEQAAQRLEPGLRLCKLDTEAHPALAQQLGIRSIPTVVVFRDGSEINRLSGALPMPQLLQWLHQTLN